ncbi:tyrosine-type recombinase/integrase [Mycobacterium frederiksbergense]|uniref:tyrosine-type recombinase/integrase n=1 Tax=Mycolicibacterium frederiksbergense TaxID=117567 RepID=UPI0021F25927|nr:site-specific integrase [Mycolicibacterium frederiksbergense]MCV7044596.1 tyrosine-type recombinase/integrase [Mycolicibacterium frederiksbergense]
MAWEKRRGKKWLSEWRKPDGQLDSKGGFATKKAAKMYGAEAERKAAMGIGFDPKAGAITFREVAEEWLDSRADELKPSTLNGYRYALKPKEQRRGDAKTLGIDAVFGGYPLNKIERSDIQKWVRAMTAAGKKPSTVRHAYEIVKMVLAMAVADDRLPANPARDVNLPTDHTAGRTGGVVDEAQFLTPEQVKSLADALPWPFNVYVHVAAWSGLRAAELCGLNVGDVLKTGMLRVDRTVRVIDGTMTTLTPKTKGSRRKVPLPPPTLKLLRDYLADHPYKENPGAVLFPNMRLKAPRPTGIKTTDAPASAKEKAQRQADALAALTVEEVEARLVLDWDERLRHQVFYKALYRPAVTRANRIARAAEDDAAMLPPELKFHALRHTYASLCAAVDVPVREVAEMMGHASPRTTETVYTHLFNTDDHAAAMGRLGALATRKRRPRTNVLPFAQKTGG